MSCIIQKSIANCASCKVLLNDKKWLKTEKNVIIALITLGIKKTIAKHVFENNTMEKTKRTLIIGRSGCGKSFLMLSLTKNKNPDDVFFIL